MLRDRAYGAALGSLAACVLLLTACSDGFGLWGDDKKDGASSNEAGAGGDAGGGGADGNASAAGRRDSGEAGSPSDVDLDLNGESENGGSDDSGVAGGAGRAGDDDDDQYACAKQETCGNGLDDNCNQQVDEGCICEGGETQPCYDGRPDQAGNGVCTMGQQACAGGELANWRACVGAGAPQPLDCSIEPGTDFDCDGEPDSGCNCILGEVRECYDGPDGTEGVAACRAGTQECVETDDGSDWTECEGQVLPEPERCDGEDYDCDGEPNSGCDCELGETRSCYDGPDGTEGVADCKEGTQTCIDTEFGVGWSPCEGQVLPEPELCDGEDYDCDGDADTGCACDIGATRACYGGPSETAGVGLCQEGQQICLARDGGGSDWGACDGEVLPAVETCNGVDADCDGAPNPDCICEVGENQACYLGPSETRRVGACRDGQQVCVAAADETSTDWGDCEGEVGPTSEVCDGVDNDCDGTTDEGCLCNAGDQQECYTGPAGTTEIGLCSPGTQRCITNADGGTNWDTCTGQVLPVAEVCGNGLDDDCDGSIDEECGDLVCPSEVSILAGSSVLLTASGVDITAWSWAVIDGPTGGADSVVWSPTSPMSSTESFQPFIVGDYLIQVTGTASAGRTLTCTTTVHSLPHGFRVELTWDGAGDVDLHLHNADMTPWFTQSTDYDDCYYGYRTVAWGAALDTDNTSSYGPENIRIDTPALGTPYTIGIHNYANAEGRVATVRIFCGSDAVPQATYVSRALAGTSAGDDSPNDFWKVAQVEFTTLMDCDVTPIDTYVTASAVYDAF